MKHVTVIFAFLLVAADSARLDTYNLPSTDFSHGSSSIGGGFGSFSTSHGTGGSFISSDHNTGGSFITGDSFSSGHSTGGSFITGDSFSSGHSTGGSFISSGHSISGSFGSSGHFGGGSFGSSGFGFGGSCSGGQVRHVDGRCVTPEVQRQVYVYNIPQQSRPTGPRPHVPLPKVEHNILFVRLPENAGSPDPIVVPPPQQKNIVYVLSKGGADGGQKVINVPAPAKTQPEVYFVDYDEGQNPTLPGGVDLQSALSSASHQGVGQVIGSGGSSGGGFIGGGFVGGISSGLSGSGFTSGISGSGFTSGISGGFISGGDHSFVSGGHNVISEPSSIYTTP